MLEGLADEEEDQYLQENLKIVPLFEIDVAEAISPYLLQPDVTEAIRSYDKRRRCWKEKCSYHNE
jgi:hypothetical protein